MQVTIGIPSAWGFWVDEMSVSLIQGLARFHHPWLFSVKRGCYLDHNRELIMQDAIAAKSERVLFIDTDIVFPPDAMARLIAHKQPIIGGIYNEKRLPAVSTVKMLNGEGGYLAGSFPTPAEPFQCAAVATGFLSIHVPTITSKMTPPYFEYDHEDREFMGEDVKFMRDARAAGLEVWADPTIPLRHMGLYPY